MTTPENTALAAEIAARFGETGERPRAQIARMIGLMGAEWVRNVVVLVESGEHPAAPPLSSGVARTRGGLFFWAARSLGSAEVGNGRVVPRDFFRCFTDRPPQPRTPKAPPVKAPKLPRMPAGAHVTAGNVRRQPRAAVPEVYVVRGRAGAGR